MTAVTIPETTASPALEGDGWRFALRSRPLAALTVAVAALTMGLSQLPSDSGSGWMLRVAAVSALFSLIPGAVTLLACRPWPFTNLLEFMGYSIAVSFVEVQLLTVMALTLHWSPVQAMMAFAVAIAAQLVLAARVSGEGVLVRVTRGELLLLLLLTTLACYLYAAGSPFDGQEDRIHMSIVQRLAHLSWPAIDNIYLSPGVVYTYPFPGTHYLMALMSRLGGIEPLFLYHKLRVFWGVTAIVLLYGCARAVLVNAHAALAVALVAVALVANGTFAGVPGMYWGQMAPYSHASDVAMGVLLPALLLLSLGYLRATSRRETRVCLAASVGMACMLIVVHPREIVQFLVYLAVFGLVMVMGRGPRPLVVRTLVMLGAVLGLLLAYRSWYQFAVASVDVLVSDRRERVWGLFVENTWADLLGYPLPLLDEYMPAFAALFQGWNPVILLASPIVLYAFRHRRLVYLPSGSILAYLLIIRLPALAIPYAYATYFEILYTPVRNVVFFIHLLAGATLYVAAACVAPAAAWVAIELFNRVGALASTTPDALFVPVLIAHTVLLAGILRRPRPDDSGGHWVDTPHRAWRVAFALLLVPIVAATWAGESAVVTGGWVNRLPTPAALLAGLECREEGRFCPPPSTLIQFARAQVPVDAILAVDYREAYEPTVFMPQQVVVWSAALEGLAEPRRMFPGYFLHLDRARATSRDQPFFDLAETREERLAFIRDLRITHVLLNPRLYSEMKRVFDSDRSLFAPLYDDGQWALFRVTS
jgi:hypothetical protein